MFINFLRSKLEKSICSMSPFFVKKKKQIQISMEKKKFGEVKTQNTNPFWMVDYLRLNLFSFYSSVFSNFSTINLQYLGN